MKGIIKIEALPNGARQNQLCQLETIPEGWALIPDDLELPETFPFVDLTVETFTEPAEEQIEEGEETVTEPEDIPEAEEGQEEPVAVPERYGVPIVTSMTAGVKPEVEPADWPAPSSGSDVWDELDAAYQEGVNDV